MNWAGFCEFHDPVWGSHLAKSKCSAELFFPLVFHLLWQKGCLPITFPQSPLLLWPSPPLSLWVPFSEAAGPASLPGAGHCLWAYAHLSPEWWVHAQRQQPALGSWATASEHAQKPTAQLIDGCMLRGSSQISCQKPAIAYDHPTSVAMATVMVDWTGIPCRTNWKNELWTNLFFQRFMMVYNLWFVVSTNYKISWITVFLVCIHVWCALPCVHA